MSDYRDPWRNGRPPRSPQREHPDHAMAYDGDDYYADIKPLSGTKQPSAPSMRFESFDDSYSPTAPLRRAAPVKAPKNTDPSLRRNIIIVVSILFILLNVAVTYLLMLYGAPSVPLKIATVMNMINDEQTDMLVGAYINSTINATRCTVDVDGHSGTMQLSDCEFMYAGRTPSTKNEFIVTTDSRTGEAVVYEYTSCGVLSFNKTLLCRFINALNADGSQPVAEPRFEIDYDSGIMTVYSGASGWGVDISAFAAQLADTLSLTSPRQPVSIYCAGGIITPSELSADAIYAQAATEAKDAYTTNSASGETIYHSEIIGVSFDKNLLAGVIASGSSPWQVPVTVTRPKIDLREIKKYTFPDLLASYYTYYDPGNRERSSNLSLAADYINSKILEPGEQFSFNDTVGERTAERGFKIAGVYAGEGTAEGYGGGICQTSSTLYYTTVLANLKTDDRSNHMYTVGYMQTATTRRTVYGNDATVNWGWSDFKFTNSKEYPIRLDIWAKDGILTCEIRGTADGSTADLVYVQNSTIPYQIKYLPDKGSSDQAGHNGMDVTVYRVVYQDGAEVDRFVESVNDYKPMNKVYYTNDLPAGFEYGVLYDQNYTPPATTTTETEAA